VCPFIPRGGERSLRLSLPAQGRITHARDHPREVLRDRARACRADAPGHPEVGEIDARFREHYGGSAFDWSERGLYVRLDADRFLTYSRTRGEHPDT